jgi:hypothetical protein
LPSPCRRGCSSLWLSWLVQRRRRGPTGPRRAPWKVSARLRFRPKAPLHPQPRRLVVAVLRTAVAWSTSGEPPAVRTLSRAPLSVARRRFASVMRRSLPAARAWRSRLSAFAVAPSLPLGPLAWSDSAYATLVAKTPTAAETVVVCRRRPFVRHQRAFAPTHVHHERAQPSSCVCKVHACEDLARRLRRSRRGFRLFLCRRRWGPGGWIGVAWSHDEHLAKRGVGGERGCHAPRVSAGNQARQAAQHRVLQVR